MAVGALLLGALTVLISALSLWRGWDAAMKSANAEARNLAILIDRNVSTVLDRAGVVLGATAAHIEHDIALHGIDQRGLRNMVDNATSLVPEIAQISIFDDQGQQVCGEQASRCLNLNVTDRDYFHQLRTSTDGTVRLFGPYRTGVDLQPTLVLARALRGAGGSFAGLAIALIPLQQFDAILAAVDVGQSGVIALRGGDLGLILRHPRPSSSALAASGPTISADFARAIQASPRDGSFHGASPLDDVDRQTYYRRLGRFPMYVVVGLGTWEFLAPWRAQAYWTLSFLALFVASSAVIARLLLRASRDQQRIQNLYDDAPCGYHSLGVDGIYHRINATELRWLGCSRDQVIGKLGLPDFLTPEGKAVFQDSFRRFQETGHIEGVEYDLLGRDGTVRRVAVSATAVRDAQGRIVFSNSVMYDITELQSVRLELNRFVAELENRVEQRTHEMRLLAAELDASESRERMQIARDLHDDLGQTLAAARIHLTALQSSSDPQARETAVRVAELIDGANRSTRSLAAQLSPPMLYELGLTAALEWLGDEIMRRFGLKVSVVDDGQPKPLCKEARSILYRATRELLINSAKHAHADQAEIEIERRADEIVVRVADSGVGFDVTLLSAAMGQGMGLLSVRERLAFIGGSVDIRSTPGDGAVITLVAPLTPVEGGPVS